MKPNMCGLVIPNRRNDCSRNFHFHQQTSQYDAACRRSGYASRKSRRWHEPAMTRALRTVTAIWQMPAPESPDRP